MGDFQLKGNKLERGKKRATKSSKVGNIETDKKTRPFRLFFAQLFCLEKSFLAKKKTPKFLFLTSYAVVETEDSESEVTLGGRERG